MKVALAIILLSTSSAYAGNVYQCKMGNGDVVFQDRPCSGETIKVSEAIGDFNSEYRNELIKAVAKMRGTSDSQLKDPKVRKAVEALAAIDAAKSYAFTKIYGVAAKYCGADVKHALSNYKAEASNIIALGRYYYRNGISVNVDEIQTSQSGRELTDGLEGMLVKLNKEHATLSGKQLKRKCRGASKSLASLTKLYSN